MKTALNMVKFGNCFRNFQDGNKQNWFWWNLR